MKNNPLDVSNYRPVSILSIVSKILERSIFFQLNEFLTKNNLLYEYQSGFRSRYSTDTCLMHLLDYIKGNNARGLYTGMIMLDLQKAFWHCWPFHSLQKSRRNGCYFHWMVSVIPLWKATGCYHWWYHILPRFSYLWGSPRKYTRAFTFSMLREWYGHQCQCWL